MIVPIGFPKVDFSVICYLFLIIKHSFSSPYIQKGPIKKHQTKQAQTNKKSCSNLPHSQNKLHSASKGISIPSSPNEAVEF